MRFGCEFAAGRDEFPASLGIPCAVGLAVETFDAWMIADQEAMRTAAEGRSVACHRDPESLDAKVKTAKDHARSHLGEGLAAKYAIIADQLDLMTLKRVCSQGFGEFADEVRTYLRPVVESGK